MATSAAHELEIDVDHIHENWQSPFFRPDIEQLQQTTSLGDFFELANAQAVKMCMEDPVLVPQGIDRDKVERVLNNVDYTGIEPLSDEYWSILAVAMTKAYISRKIVREAVESHNELKLSETEKVVLLGSLDIADHTDRLFWEYRENVVTSSLAQRFVAMGDEAAISFLQKQGVLPEKPDEFLYVVFKESEPGQIETQTYAEAFPEAVGGIAKAMDGIVKKLRNIDSPVDPAETTALINYYYKLRQALISTNAADHAQLFEDVDILWGKIHGRMQPVHMMEVYEDSLGLRVDPDYSLRFIDDRYGDVNELSLLAKQYVIDYMREDYFDFTSMQASLPALKSSVVGVFTGVANSGRWNVFKAGGQNVPNREIVKVKNGVKIFIDMGTMLERFQTEKVYLDQLFGKEVAARVFADEEKIVKYITGFFVGGHEDGHCAFIQLGTRVALGTATYKAIEENKADQSIVVAVPEQLEPEDLRVFILGFIASLTRDLTLGKDPAKRPYYNGGLVSLNIMYEVGILAIGENGHLEEPDLSMGKMTEFFKKSRQVFRELALTYEHLSHEEAVAYTEKYYQETPFVRYVLSKMGLEPNVSIAAV